MTENMELFFDRRPRMAEKFQFPGTFMEFADNIAGSVPAGSQSPLLKEKIVSEVKRMLPDAVSPDLLESQLNRSPIISYADHHGLLNHPLLYNSNILYAEIVKQLKLPYIVVFATGNVPLKNQSYPRGFYFNHERYNFFKNKLRHIPVYLLEEKIVAEKGKGLESFVLNFKSAMFTEEERKFLEFLFFECLDIETVSQKFEKFSDQVTYMNYKIWKYYFHQNIRETIPDIVYLQSNQIVMDLLLREIAKEDSLISSILFDSSVRQVFLKNFHGIACCWGDNMGSQLFWGVSEKKKFINLHCNQDTNKLVGEGIQIELERECVIDALKSKRILPTIFIDFLIITFMEGYLALGGFNQIEFLTDMKTAHIKSLQEIGWTDLIKPFTSRVTDGLVCGMLPFEFNSGIDLIWYFNSKDGKFNRNIDKGLSREFLDTMLEMKTKNMIASAIETMMDNISRVDM